MDSEDKKDTIKVEEIEETKKKVPEDKFVEGTKPSNKKKYLLISLGALIFIIAIVGGYYAYGQYQENKYYENYRLEVYNGEQANKKFNNSENILNNYNFTSMTTETFNNEYPNILADLDKGIKNVDEAIVYDQKARNHQNEMLKSASTDYQKQYAELLIKQSDLYMKIYDIKKQHLNLQKELYTAVKNNDLNKVKDINKQINDVVNQGRTLFDDMQKIINEREDIRSSHPSFTNRLNIEKDIAENATMN